MAITQTQILNVCISMFNAAPGATNLANIQAWVDANTEATTADLAASLGVLEEFTGLYTGTDAEKAISMAGNFGLTSGTGYDAAVAYFTQELAAGTSMDSMLATANDFLLNSDAAILSSFGLTDAATTLTNKTTVAEYYSVTKAVSGDTIADLQAAVSSVTASTASVTAAQTSIDDAVVAASIDGDTFTLTTSDDDVVNGTANSDLIDGSTVGTLQSADIILDNSSDDSDVLNAQVTSSGVSARIQNVENINVTGEYVNTGLNLTNVTGTETLTLDTELASGTASVTGANSLNAENIVAGSNIKTINVTSLASGTRDTVSIDANNATTIGLTGEADGADKYDVTIAADATVTMTTFDSTGDTVTINAAGDFTLDTAGDNDVVLSINSSAASEVTLSDNDEVAGEITFTGAQDITISADNEVAFNNVEMTDSSTATTTLKVDLTGAADFKAAAVDYVNIESATNDSLTVNADSTVVLSGDFGTNEIQIDNADGEMDNDANSGTLKINVAEDQSATISTGDHVSTVIIQAAADEATDTDTDENGTVDNEIDAGTLSLNAATDTVVVQGSEDLTINITAGADDQVVTATSMTGDLTITADDSTNDMTVVAGQGDDTIVVNNDTAEFTVYGGDGADDITVTAGNDTSTVYGQAGDDTITAANGNDITYDGGTGSDTFNAGDANDTITTGTGSDIINIDDNDADSTGTVTVTDFTTGTDTIVLSGTSVGDVDLSDVTITSSVHMFDNDGAGDTFQVTLTDVTATDLTDSVQLGTQSATAVTAFVAENDATIVAGDKDDVIQIGDANESATITSGDGSDTIILVGADGNDTDVTVDDFTVGSDKIVLTGVADNDTSIDLSDIDPVTGTYSIGSEDVTLTSGGTDFTTTDLSSIVQLGHVGTALSITSAAAAVEVNGSSFDDYVSITGVDTTNDATFLFRNDGSYDTVTLEAGVANDVVDFGTNITGITAGSETAIDADNDAIADAQNGYTYVFADSEDGAGTSAIASFVAGKAYATKGSPTTTDDSTITADTILDDVAAFLEANLGEGDGETYVAVINDGNNAGTAYAYLIEADADGIGADDLTLLGVIKDTASGTDAITVLDIA